MLICIKGTRDKRNFGNTSNFYEYGLCLVPLGSIIIFGSVLDVLWLTEVSFWQEARIVLCAAVLVCMNVLIFWIYDRHQQMMININNLQLRLQGEEADNKYYHMLNAFCGAQRTPMRFRADAMRSITDAPKRSILLFSFSAGSLLCSASLPA